jgi:hypothetical protein
VTTVIVPQLHDPVMCQGAGDRRHAFRWAADRRDRFGGRQEDYRAVGADPKTQTMRAMAERVAS